MIEGQGALVPLSGTRLPVAEAVATADSLCWERWVSLTVLRYAVLETLHHAGHPMGAYDLIPRLAVVFERAPMPQTVYRVLDFLRDEGLMARIESPNASVPFANPAGSHACVFLLCESCGVAMEVESPDPDEVIVRDAASLGFGVGKRMLELHGTYAQCLASAGVSATNAL